MRNDYVLDAGALGMLAENDSRLRGILFKINLKGGQVYVPAVVLAECLGDARYDASYYRALKNIGGLDECAIDVDVGIAQRAGAILKESKSKETIDGIIVAAAESLGAGTRIITGDRDHMTRLAASASVRLGILGLSAL